MWRTALENGAHKFRPCAIGAQPRNPRIIPEHMFFFQNVQQATAMLVLNTLFSEFLHYNFEYTK